MAVLPDSTVFTKLFTSTHISIIILYREVGFCFCFLLYYCSLVPLGPDFQNGADHWRQIGMSLNLQGLWRFFVPATQARVTSEDTWFPKCRWLTTADIKIDNTTPYVWPLQVGPVIVQHLKCLFRTSYLYCSMITENVLDLCHRVDSCWAHWSPL